MKRILPILLLCVLLPFALPGCNSDVGIHPGAEAYQTQVGPDGKVTETTQGVRVRLVTVKTEAAVSNAAETAEKAAGDFKEGGEANKAAASDAKEASHNVIWAAIIVIAGLILLTLIVLVAVALFRRK